MANLKTEFLGLEIRNPIVVGSSGLTSSAEKIAALEKSGAAAVVLKSLFEEEILLEFEQLMGRNLSDMEDNLEFLDYYDYQLKEEVVKKTIKLIREAKAAVKIPIIASINCASNSEWVDIAIKLEEAGADGLEINMNILPADQEKLSVSIEDAYIDIIRRVKERVSIPLGVKIGPYFTNLARMIDRIDKAGVQGVVLFNRTYSPDIDIEEESVTSSSVLSQPADLTSPLRWVGIMKNRVKCNLVSTTGIHNGEALIKQLLVGSDSVEVVSSIYKQGNTAIGGMLKELESWMERKGYDSIADFKGNLSQKNIPDPGRFDRVQFMKHFGGEQV